MNSMAKALALSCNCPYCLIVMLLVCVLACANWQCPAMVQGMALSMNVPLSSVNKIPLF